MNEAIQYIDISLLHPHPDNPRKDLGNLTELADSIKAKGILQNLTVVPWFSKITGVGCDDPKQQAEMGYTVVIGHRRRAAAELAGLKELPCVISDMNRKEQVATMLLENIQRSDLTVYEQANGFQMMLDLGDNIKNISERTGFSESTIRHRVKLMELDDKKLKESVERGGTLMDYAELEKIHDPDLRNGVLETIGTSNFKWKLQQTIDKEKTDKKMAVMISCIEKFAKRITETNGYMYIKAYYPSQTDTINPPSDVGTVEYFFKINSWGIDLYKKNDQPAPKRNIQDPKRDEIHALLENMSKRAYQLRREFVIGISTTWARKNMGAIADFMFRTVDDSVYNFEFEELAAAFEIKLSDNEDDGEKEFEMVLEHVKAQPERSILLNSYFAADSESENYYGGNNEYRKNQSLDMVYDLLEVLGYEISDEERQLKEGTHELYQKTA